MQSFIIKPILGLKTNTAENDFSMFKQVGPNVFATYCVDGRNVDYARKRNTCSKAKGSSTWSNSAAATLECLGIYELWDGTNRVYWAFFATEGSSLGRLYRYDSNRDPARVSDVSDHSGAVEWAYNRADLYSVITYGTYMVLADMAEHTPYISDHNDTTLVKLVNTGTEYKFRYLESFQRRIIGAYSDQTNGDIEIRWSNANPTPGSSCSFAAGDYLYVTNDDTITGLKRMGRNACYVYSENSIHRLDYYASYELPFGITNVISNIGISNHHSIIDAGNMHYFFSPQVGFCQFNGVEVVPISADIENWVSDMRYTYHNLIVGTFIHRTNEAVWTVPLEGSTENNALLFYNRYNGTWRREDKAARYIAQARFTSNMTWTMLTTAYGYTTWSDLGNLRWSDLYSEGYDLAYASNDGKLYLSNTEADNGSAFDGYRIEPIMDFGLQGKKSLLLEIWFDLAEVGSYSLYCYYRGGNTLAECKNANWTALTEVSCDSPANAVIRTNQMNRYHQIKWGSDGADEPFSVASIEFKYVPQGVY